MPASSGRTLAQRLPYLATHVVPTLREVLSRTEMATVTHVAEKLADHNNVSVKAASESAPQQLATPPSMYSVTRNTDTARWHAPRYSLRHQAALRKAQLISTSVLDSNYNQLPIGAVPVAAPDGEPRKLLRKALPKLPKDVRLKAAKRERVAEKLAQMDKILDDWRRTKRNEKEKLKSDLPF
ncbi:hypothetical protein BC828DRAFT_373333 [Blastocladiella britannica]|nr:hypothetical protein BC828DRAFT_373333 [Blastocladiella britannica]